MKNLIKNIENLLERISDSPENSIVKINLRNNIAKIKDKKTGQEILPETIKLAKKIINPISAPFVKQLVLENLEQLSRKIKKPNPKEFILIYLKQIVGKIKKPELKRKT